LALGVGVMGARRRGKKGRPNAFCALRRPLPTADRGERERAASGAGVDESMSGRCRLGRQPAHARHKPAPP